MSTPFTASWLTENAVGSTMLNLSNTILARLPIALPPLWDQEQIASAMSACDMKLRAYAKRLYSVEALFQSLLHNLMSGDVRLPPFKNEAPEC